MHDFLTKICLKLKTCTSVELKKKKKFGQTYKKGNFAMQKKEEIQHPDILPKERKCSQSASHAEENTPKSPPFQ